MDVPQMFQTLCRWKNPISVAPWSPKVYDATKVKPGCPQKGCETMNPVLVCPKQVRAVYSGSNLQTQITEDSLDLKKIKRHRIYITGHPYPSSSLAPIIPFISQNWYCLLLMCLTFKILRHQSLSLDHSIDQRCGLDQ